MFEAFVPSMDSYPGDNLSASENNKDDEDPIHTSDPSPPSSPPIFIPETREEQIEFISSWLEDPEYFHLSEDERRAYLVDIGSLDIELIDRGMEISLSDFPEDSQESILDRDPVEDNQETLTAIPHGIPQEQGEQRRLSREEQIEFISSWLEDPEHFHLSEDERRAHLVDLGSLDIDLIDQGMEISLSDFIEDSQESILDRDPISLSDGPEELQKSILDRDPLQYGSPKSTVQQNIDKILDEPCPESDIWTDGLCLKHLMRRGFKVEDILAAMERRRNEGMAASLAKEDPDRARAVSKSKDMVYDHIRDPANNARSSWENRAALLFKGVPIEIINDALGELPDSGDEYSSDSDFDDDDSSSDRNKFELEMQHALVRKHLNDRANSDCDLDMRRAMLLSLGVSEGVIDEYLPDRSGGQRHGAQRPEMASASESHGPASSVVVDRGDGTVFNITRREADLWRANFHLVHPHVKGRPWSLGHHQMYLLTIGLPQDVIDQVLGEDTEQEELLRFARGYALGLSISCPYKSPRFSLRMLNAPETVITKILGEPSAEEAQELETHRETTKKELHDHLNSPQVRLKYPDTDQLLFYAARVAAAKPLSRSIWDEVLPQLDLLRSGQNGEPA